MNVLAKVMRAAWDEANKPMGDVSGEEFGRFLRERLFPRESYDLLHRTHDYPVDNNDYITFSKLPNFRFRAKNSYLEFYVHTKFRSKIHDDGLEWCKSYQLKRYQEINESCPVLVAVGLGGHPGEPDKVFLIPVSHIRFVKMYPSFLKRYQITPSQSVSPHYIKSILS